MVQVPPTQTSLKHLKNTPKQKLGMVQIRPRRKHGFKFTNTLCGSLRMFQLRPWASTNLQKLDLNNPSVATEGISGKEYRALV